MLKIFNLVTLILIGSSAVHAQSVISYNTFQELPQRSDQQPGFGYYGGAQATTSTYGMSFIPAISGFISDIWIGVGSSQSDPGTDIFDLYITTSGSLLEPDIILGAAEIQGELSKRESIVRISSSQDIFINQGEMYWMLVSPGVGTPEVGWLGGPPNAIPGSYSAYLDSKSPTGWFIAPFNANGALRIDVTPVPEPSSYLFMFVGLTLLFVRVRKSNCLERET